MKHLSTLLLAVVLIIQTQYMVDNVTYVDYTLDGEQYEGVAYDDMLDNYNAACATDAESQVQ